MSETIGSKLSSELVRVKRLLETTTDPITRAQLQQEQELLVAQLAAAAYSGLHTRY